MKKILNIIMPVLMLASCDENIPGPDPIVPATDILIDCESLEMNVGEEKRLVAEILPENATFKKIIWNSSAPETVSVDQNGVMTALAQGNAVIRAMSGDELVSAECSISVNLVIHHVTGIKVNPQSVELYLGDNTETRLTAEVFPANATDKSYTWASGNPDVVMVNEDGCLVPVGEGKTDVTAIASDGGFTGSCTVVVKSKKEQINLLSNPGFEDGLTSWERVPLEWFETYYKGETLNTASWNSSAAGVSDEKLWTGTGADVKDLILSGSICAKLAMASLSGLYQIVAVEGGYKYHIAVNMLWKRGNVNNQSIKEGEHIKILSEDGSDEYGTVPIPVLEKEMMKVEGDVSIPAGVAKVRFQIDQRDYPANPAGQRAPLLLFDECSLIKMD
ncbi:MAG: Ig domain-containing protein [Candidatus Cryptobacteroides sp.]